MGGTPDQTSLTIARLLVEEVVSCHGVPHELLSNRSTNFLSRLMEKIYELLGIKKTSYHPHMDGLVERFHRTILDMMAKTSKSERKIWDERLPYLLFAYRATVQELTRASPFQLLYGRKARLPTTHVLEPHEPREVPEGYCEEFAQRMATAWADAQTNVEKAQLRQKRYHDQIREATQFQEGEVVYVFMPSRMTGKKQKLQRPHVGPYQITRLWLSGGREIGQRPIRIALERLWKCPPELVRAAGLENHVAESPEEQDVSKDAPDAPSLQDAATGKDRAEPTASWTSRIRPWVRMLSVDVDVTRALQPKGGGCNKLINTATPA